ncbi:MAG TPA: UPF0182 family protein [Marmoricola sp.]|nr:UPF0182 family protein [Marmoricola sp.]
MSDFFDDPPRPGPGGDRPAQRPPARPRRPRPVVLTIIVVALFLLLFSIFAGIWTEKLWFGALGYGEVFNKLIWTRTGLFVGFGLLMALIVGGNLAIAFRLRPLFRPSSPEQANLERYREVVTPLRRPLLLGVSAVFGIFAGISASGQWRTFLLWTNGKSFGEVDPYFEKDVGFYVFTLPWLHWLVDFTMTAVVLALLASALVHYVYGGIRLQARANRVSGGAQAQLSALFGVLVLLKGADYYLDRFDLTSQQGSLITGMTYARDHAMLPSKNILMAIAVICAVLFFANVIRRTWMLPSVGLVLFVISAVLLGFLWPALVQRFQVKPDEPDKEAPYIAANIKATREAFDIADSKVSEYDAKTALSPEQLKQDAASLPGIRLLDPTVVTETFEQLQQVRGYYTVPGVLDVDRYQIDGRERDMVIAARELDLSGLPDEQKNWNNLHTVYTHGYGIIAAYGNQRDPDGAPVFAEENLPPTGKLSQLSPGGYRGQIYYGENSPEYSLVGKAPNGKDIELDIPQGTDEEAGGQASRNTYDGKGGVEVGSLFRKLLYAVKFNEPNFLLSSRIHGDSKVLYNRAPIERVQKVAPWLTVDNDALPAVVDGRIVWLLDGYTVTDRFPLSQKRSMEEMTNDAINPRTTFATLPTDEINYIRNAVKISVDAYDGTVTLYEWDQKDPMLKAWESIFPGLVKPKSKIPEDMLQHMRYPEDLFKVQRNMLAEYHVTNAKTFYEGTDRWEVPQDPNSETNKQPPYRLSVATKTGAAPVFSLTSVYVPFKRQNLASFIAVGADAADPKTYGDIQILRLPDNTQVPGPSQIANQFNSDDKIANRLLAFKRAGTNVISGNLLTLPVGGGLLYVQPVYTVREGGAGNYPVLRYVLTSFGSEVGIGSTLSESLDDVLGTTGVITGERPSPDGDQTSGKGLPAGALRLLQQADEKFRQADQALKKGDLAGYQKAVDEGRDLLEQALRSGQKAGAAKGSGS